MKVFNELRKLYLEKEQNNLVIFVGAGISENYSIVEGDKGFPSWNKLIEQLSLEDLTKNKLDFLKIAQIFQDNHSKEALVHKVKEIFPEDYNFHDIHKLIFDLEPTHILTTNYDTLLEKAMRFKNLDTKYHTVDTDDLIPLSKSKQNLLVKAHGDLCRGNIVLSEQDYNDYEKNFPLILSFIRFVFSKYKVLFIGFSLTDPNFNKILYWVKNILEENTIKHTVILHNDISESERVHFQKKSVNVITREEIVNEILKEDSNKDNYLLESLNFIKNGFPNQKYSAEQRLDVVKANLQSLKYFEYLLPEMINSFLENSYLTFNYSHFPEVNNTTQKDKKDVRYPWICNIYQTDSYLDGKAKFNLFNALGNKSNNVYPKKDFLENYFSDFATLLLMNNLSSIGDISTMMIGEHNIPEMLNEKSNEKISHYLTYTYTKQNDKVSLDEYDNSFELESPFYKELIFDKNLFYSNYLIGDKTEAYKKCKKLKYRDSIEKYFVYFRLHFLWSGRKISNYDEIDNDTINMYEYIFDNMDKHNQKIFSTVHRLEFIHNYFNFITDLENDFFVLLKSNSNEWRTGFDRKTLYWISFYINFSRFLKFIILNKLPILENNLFQKSIHKSNLLYLKNFMKSYNNKEDTIHIPNWILIGFLFDNDIKNIRLEVIDSHLKHMKNPYNLSFDKEYIRNLFINNLDVVVNDGHLYFANILYLFSLSTKDEENFLFILELLYLVVNHDIKNIEQFSEQLHIAYINYSKHNTFSNEIKNKLLSILNLYITYKLDFKKDETSFDDNKFSNFLFDLDIKFLQKDEKILEKLNTELDDISCQNLSSFIYLLNIIGYEAKDLEKNIISPIRNRFDKKDFYSNEQHPFNKCLNQIENSIVKLYVYFNIDLGIHKIEAHYLGQLINDLEQNGYSSRIGDSMEWLLFLMKNEIISSKFYKKIKKKSIQEKLENKLSSLFKSESTLLFDNWRINSKNQFIEFLLNVNSFNVVKNVFNNLTYDKNSEYFLNMFIYLIRRNYLFEHHKQSLIDLLDLFMESQYKHLISPIKQLIKHCIDLENNELQSILINILENKKEDI